jgi:hypothetical protein
MHRQLVRLFIVNKVEVVVAYCKTLPLFAWKD